MNIMLLAAGEGTRLRPHTLKTPKPAIPFLNVPLAFYSLHLAPKANILVVNTYHLAQKIQKLFTDFSSTKHDKAPHSLKFSNETEKILGSGGGLGHARDCFDNADEILLMNSDEVILPISPVNWDAVLFLHRAKAAISTLFVMEHPEVGSKFGGVWVNDKDQVIGFGKTRPEGTVKGFHFVGIQILDQRVFKYIPRGEESNILHDVLTKAIAAGEVINLYRINCHWFETGNESDFLSATHDCLKLYESSEYLQGLLNSFSPNSIMDEVNHSIVLKDKNSDLPANVVVNDFAVIGAGVKLPIGAQLTKAVIGAEAPMTENKISGLYL